MEYDFSKIKTEELRESIDFYHKNNNSVCSKIECIHCPFNSSIESCRKSSTTAIHILLNAELDRREEELKG